MSIKSLLLLRGTNDGAEGAYVGGPTSIVSARSSDVVVARWGNLPDGPPRGVCALVGRDTSAYPGVIAQQQKAFERQKINKCPNQRLKIDPLINF